MQERTHKAEMVTAILDQIGPGQNRCLAFSTFTFKQGQHTKSYKINHFQCILYTFTMQLNSMSYIQYILVMVYTNFSGFLGTIVDQQVSGCIKRNLTFISLSLVSAKNYVNFQKLLNTKRKRWNQLVYIPVSTTKP